jgi:sterol desaturase/sphingolipid hydroxylase (fatty acid hydroxylase superfamily)
MLHAAYHWYFRNSVRLFVIAVIGAIAVEIIGRLIRRKRVDVAESATSLVSGVTFIVTKTLVSKLVMLSLSLYVYRTHRLTTLDLSNSWVWVGVFFLRDVIYYWVHRVEHRVRMLWASHMIHHSPDTIGFATAVRVPWMEAIYKPWLGLWVPLIGFNPLAFVALDVLAATIGQLQHTTACRKRTVLDTVFVTPSAHRVHHASNKEYIDKNFGAVFIIWDRLFGTYAPEVAPVVYGLTGGKTLDTPTDVLVGGYPQLVQAARSKPSMTEAVRYLVAAPS